ncbi:MAG TPA: ABC transporter permease [Vicinamibacteria bacterium]|mgnify:CR=1 FL=1|nr:ABC transporter permease [Vicinamibacteria bacterium]HRB11432.1 ABC transporter permease [Vicinamibacteria bacterium]
MALPISYNIRNVRVRWQVTLLAISGIALVVAVFSILLSMSAGFQMALRATGRPDNALIVQRGSASELTSGVRIDDRNTILADDRIARRPDGSPLASWEWVVVMSLPKVDNGGSTNVTLRAVPPQAFEVRGGIDLVEGRNFQTGLDEVIVGRKIMGRIEGLKLGQQVKYMDKRFTVVGVFESRGGAFESEIWGDFNVMGAMFQRGAGSNSVVVRMKDASQIPALDKWIRSQPQMQLQAVPEPKYYSDQAGPLAAILKGLAAFVAFVMGVGAVFGAMNTMYAIVASRTREIGTLRALGFSRFSILSSFVMESVVLATLAGAIGILLAMPMNGFSTGTAQTQSFSEVAFSFQLTPAILMTGMVFAALMGLVGGLLPALRAARMPITRALRDA